MKVAEFLDSQPNRMWRLAKQMGIRYAVTGMGIAHNGQKPWDYEPLLRMAQRFRDNGITPLVVESRPPANKIKLGLPGRDEEVESVITLIRNMGRVGIPVYCYDFMAEFNWLRTSMDIPTRGGALATGYDHSVMANAPMTESGIVTEDQLWSGLKYMLQAIVPEAEAAGVKLALHPDDPPISPIRGVSRILVNAAAMRRAIELVPSPNSGITLCAGTMATAGEDIPHMIRDFTADNKLFFAHFRDVVGTPEKFQEVFHECGQNHQPTIIRTYKECGYEGPIRSDHVPTMDGESNDNPGYEVLGRLYGIGYMKGLMHAAGFDLDA